MIKPVTRIVQWIADITQWSCARILGYEAKA